MRIFKRRYKTEEEKPQVKKLTPLQRRAECEAKVKLRV